MYIHTPNARNRRSTACQMTSVGNGMPLVRSYWTNKVKKRLINWSNPYYPSQHPKPYNKKETAQYSFRLKYFNIFTVCSPIQTELVFVLLSFLTFCFLIDSIFKVNIAAWTADEPESSNLSSENRVISLGVSGLFVLCIRVCMKISWTLTLVYL
jgi:hypothetical protein